MFHETTIPLLVAVARLTPWYTSSPTTYVPVPPAVNIKSSATQESILTFAVTGAIVPSWNIYV